MLACPDVLIINLQLLFPLIAMHTQCMLTPGLHVCLSSSYMWSEEERSPQSPIPEHSFVSSCSVQNLSPHSPHEQGSLSMAKQSLRGFH